MTVPFLDRARPRPWLTGALLGLALALPACDLDFMKSAEDFKAEAGKALEARDFSVATVAAQKLVTKTPEAYEAHFLLAQAKAEVGDKNGAIVALEQAIKKGLRDDTLIDGNAHLAPIKSMAAYVDLMKTSFPSRHAGTGISASGAFAGGDGGASVSIHESNGRQVLRAGDVVIEVPAAK